ncbi:2-C-methyl-D-erythritol 4-phosphate cytidylyltransferase, putative [Plasmodium knowlesi strain H]|uniref:2-C-methyl-D-erythritol 4-phosphate cytidylyltransferase, putative n=3 Tax=Plasmodium knowlesi TaxID=5850 RepID=A0A5K1UXK9_PLAKH|nr:2-C-methyl-D-erythritol 4-phosphate cytidylyltransferase, putative [Plasmodium knowlesi strain H]OTN66363.1 putative 2-C-methyl-D-erythritol 4-phosphate cytidylyltransferase [Plasmodium knowlesi]CAA9986332.1 2-C-methyl-D-erythritol 4-phosphate cytidylyltransferase, putative [Plasmodium knowlesi strain H]SBO25575.1 2-C-methyl-D-erythritol 4-phosphate cytidylyltransferase, putative [Plasmodium knowlesi strain H]SBO28316.1 2-C-methyl-D-erythritol 4-phosphate cytidylyltransferase, putative [Plas|eukprot:XP_002257737.1 hypothetical protein, conserved in Plasmodium species [Plasmodium knowlesi strain H]
MKNALLSVRLVTWFVACFSPWWVLINYFLTLQRCSSHVMCRKNSPTCANVRSVNGARMFHEYPRGQVASSLQDIKGGYLAFCAKGAKVKGMHYIVTNWKGTKRSGAYKVRFVTPDRVQVYFFKEAKNKGEWDEGIQLHATEEGANVCRENVVSEYISQEKENPHLLETSTRTEDKDEYNRREYRKYEKSLKKKNIHAILLCGGIGKRTRLASPKQLLMLNDIPLFLYSFNLFIKCNLIKSISLVCDPNYFHDVIESINKFNSTLLRRKNQRGFLRKGHSKNVLTLSDVETGRDTIEAIQFLEKNKYIIYDNEKGKCITNLDEVFNDVMEKKRQRLGGVEKEGCTRTSNRKGVRGEGINVNEEVKASDIDSNRYKLIRLQGGGPERVDSLLNGLRGLDLSVENGEYICQLLRDHAAGAEKAAEAIGTGIVHGDLPPRNAYLSHILVHDGARPFLSEFDLFNLVYMATIGKNTILGTRATDTIKRIGNEEQGEDCLRVKANVDREFIFLAHTPQIFKSELLVQVCANLLSTRGGEIQQRSIAFTDTSSLFQHFTKKKIFALQAKFPNFKITTPTDVLLAIILMGHLFSSSHGEVDMRIFKQTFVNSPSSYIPANLLNDHFFYDSLGGKQRILYDHFYYK